MPITVSDATEALQSIEFARRRSVTLRGYQAAAPHLILWGVLYAIGYSFCYARPDEAGFAWIALVPTGIAGDLAMAFWFQPRGNERAWRTLCGLFTSLAVYVIAADLVMAPAHPLAIAAFIPLLVALAYVVLGLWMGGRLLLTGVALAALTLTGFFALPGYFMVWMALVGGGALVLGGLWLRRA